MLFPGSNQTLGGNYGEATPSDLGFVFRSADSQSECTADKDPWPTVYTNTISALSAAELTRRIVQHREIPETFRFPGASWDDIQVPRIVAHCYLSCAQEELYGAKNSALFPGLQWGGMTADTGIFLQVGDVSAWSRRE